MKNEPILLGFLFLVVACAPGGYAQEATPNSEDTPQPRPLTLMGMLSEWIYPDAEFGGAKTSDAAVTGISSIKSQAVLTTDDSVEKVLTFYCDKLKVDRDGRPLGEKEDERITTDRAILVQNATGTVPSSVYLVSIHSSRSSTTLVISRDPASRRTKIAWSNYRQLLP